MKPRIVLSGPNFFEGGPLTVFQDSLRALASTFGDRYDIFAIVHRRDLFPIEGINYIEAAHTRRSWLHRLKFEYREASAICRELQPDIWLSMHDITPTVEAKVRAVYCHNPAPFYSMSWREIGIDWTFTLFNLLYRYLYGIGIHNNQFVIVQQQWMRNEFLARYPGLKTVIVAHPDLPENFTKPGKRPVDHANRPFRFFYPSFSRSFKNIERILEAVAVLETESAVPFELLLTINGSENRYAQTLYKRFQGLRSVHWLGSQPREKILDLYVETDCLLFPSRLETWGMPITEFQQTGRPILASDLPYSRETMGTYGSACFLDPDQTLPWANAMRHAIHHTLRFDPPAPPAIKQPFANGWTELFQMLFSYVEAHPHTMEQPE